jgi:two-component system, sensor histidine kinase PdtaS
MKNLCYLLLILSQIAYAQDNPYAQLEQQLSSEQTDSIKLSILKQLVDVAFRKNLNIALAYAHEGSSLSDQTNHKLWQPKFYEMEGRMHSYLLHFDSAKLMLNKGITNY